MGGPFEAGAAPFFAAGSASGAAVAVGTETRRAMLQDYWRG